MRDAEVLKEELERREARKSPEAHAEYVIKDSHTNDPIRLSEIHRSWYKHIDLCVEAGKAVGILAPWGHGKSSQIALNWVLYQIGKDPNVRVKIVKNTDDMAKTNVASISNYIEHDKKFRAVWKDCRPDYEQEWAKHRKVVKRETISPDATVESWGITSSGIGGRCDILLVDDPCDLRNTILNPAMRDQVKEAFRNVWLSRVDEPDGIIIYIATAWHQEDLTAELQKNDEFCFLIQRVSADMECIDCELVNADDVYPPEQPRRWSIPLWDFKWNKKALERRKGKVGPRAFERGYRQNPYSSEDLTIPSAEKAFRKDLRPEDIPDEWPCYAGSDPFGQWTSVVTVALSPDGELWVKDIVRLKDPKPKTFKKRFIDVARHYASRLIKVETVAAQKWIKEEILDIDRQIPVDSFTTGVNKADPEVGLKGLELLCDNGGLIIPLKHTQKHKEKRGEDCECGWCALKREMRAHPFGATADVLMGLWMAREAARPTAEGSRTFLKRYQIEKAAGHIPPNNPKWSVLSVVCARESDEQTYIYAYEGRSIVAQSSFNKDRPGSTAIEIMEMAKKFQALRIYINEDTEGVLVANKLLASLTGKKAAKVIKIKMEGEAKDKELYTDLRSQAWHESVGDFQKELVSIPEDDEKLQFQLTSVKMKPGSAGRIKAEKREETSKRLGIFTTGAEAVILALYGMRHHRPPKERIQSLLARRRTLSRSRVGYARRK